MKANPINKTNSNFLIRSIFIVILPAFFMIFQDNAYGISIDVKCAILENYNIEVRVFALGLLAKSLYTAEVVPDKSQPVVITGRTDSNGIFWTVAKISNDNEDSVFKVFLHEDKNKFGSIIVSGEDRGPCQRILSSESSSDAD